MAILLLSAFFRAEKSKLADSCKCHQKNIKRTSVMKYTTPQKIFIFRFFYHGIWKENARKLHFHAGKFLQRTSNLKICLIYPVSGVEKNAQNSAYHPAKVGVLPFWNLLCYSFYKLRPSGLMAKR